MARVISRKVKGMYKSHHPARGKHRLGQGDVKKQLQAKVSDNLASRGVSYNRDRLWEAKPSKMPLTVDEQRRLDKQRENKRRWASKERAKYRQHFEALKTKNGNLEFTNGKLKKDIEHLRRFLFQMESALAEHEPDCIGPDHTMTLSESAGLCMGTRGRRNGQAVKVKTASTLQLVTQSPTSQFSGQAFIFIPNAKDAGPLKKLTGRMVHIQNGKIVDMLTSPAALQKMNSGAKFTVPEATAPVMAASYILNKENTTIQATRANPEPADDSQVLVSGGFNVEDDTQPSYLQMLGEESGRATMNTEGDEPMVVEEISEIPLFPDREIKQEPSDGDDATFMQQVQSFKPQLEELMQKKRPHNDQAGEAAPTRRAGDVSDVNTTRNFMLGPGKLNLTSSPMTLKASDATVSKPKPRETLQMSRSNTAPTYVSPWTVAGETAEVTITAAVVGAESIITTMAGGPIVIGRKRTASETAACTFSDIASAPVQVSEPCWNDKTPRRVQSLPNGYTILYDQSLADSCLTDESSESTQLQIASDQTTPDGDDTEVASEFDILADDVDGEWQSDTDDLLSRDISGHSLVLVSRKDIPPTPSTPSTPSSVTSSNVVFISNMVP